MHMTFEKIPQERCQHCFGPMPCSKHGSKVEETVDTIRQMHISTIALIDTGFKFLKDGVDVTAEVRARCADEIATCDELLDI